MVTAKLQNQEVKRKRQKGIGKKERYL